MIPGSFLSIDSLEFGLFLGPELEGMRGVNSGFTAGVVRERSGLLRIDIRRRTAGADVEAAGPDESGARSIVAEDGTLIGRRGAGCVDEDEDDELLIVIMS